jgi:TonB family protein
MTFLQFLLINCNLILLYAAFMIVARKKGQLTFNRLFLLTIPPIAVILPFIPAIVEPTHAEWAVQLSEISIIAGHTEQAASTNFPWIQFIYLSGAIISFIIFAVKLRRVIIHPKSRHVSNYRGADVYILESSKSSYSFFNRIYINESQLEAAEVILIHESAHSRDFHSLDTILMSFYKVLLWFNPIVFLLERKVKENHEFIADEYVLKQNISREEYGKAMLMATFNCAIPSLGNGFNKKSLLRKRIEHLKHKNQFNMKHVLIIPVLTGLFLTSASLTIGPKERMNKTNSETPLPTEDVLVEPQYQGGMDALIDYLANEIKYPEALEKKGVEGRVFVEFDVDKDGSILNAKALRSSGQDEFDTEAVRAISSMPKWEPGTKNGKAVRTQMKLPIVFKLPS